jgi:large subunit ribosomal protein L1
LVASEGSYEFNPDGGGFRDVTGPLSDRVGRPEEVLSVVRLAKRYKAARAKVELGKTYDLPEAVKALQSMPKPKFDETVEVAVKLGIDPKKSDQMVRGSISLPNGIGKKLKVIVFAEGDKAKDAKEAGAVEVGSEDLAKKILGGWLDFDVAVASPDMMKHVGKLGKVLGPAGKMPSPKSGTVTADVKTAVKEFSAGKIEFRNDDGGNVHAPMGKRSFAEKQLVENITAFLDQLRAMKPGTAKGTYFEKVVISATQSPGVPVRVS